MRTTVDLIDELQMAAEGAERAALIVGFESSTIYVWADDSNPLASLNEAMKAGGTPVGIVRWSRKDGRVLIEGGPLQEFKDDEHIRSYLKDLLRVFQQPE